MAIDTLRKRASVASLGLAFLGPSVVPDSSLVQADRQVIAASYYGIAAGSSFVQIGGTSQIGNYASTGGITLERVIGGTSQIGAYSSTGGITLERILGGTSQIGAYSSSGGVTVGDAVATEEEASSGGWYFRYEQEQYRLAEERRKRKQKKEAAQKIDDELIRAIALEERKLEEREARDKELARLTKLVAQNIEDIDFVNSEVEKVAIQAIETQKFAAMEKMERLLKRQWEEEQFLLMATQVILNG